MPVDMFPKNFIQKLRRVPPFDPPEGPTATSQMTAWHHTFTAVTLLKHTEGYRLFGYGAFCEHLKRVLCVFDQEKYGPQFESPRFINLMKSFYESAMGKAFVYSCIVDAFEGKMKHGLIFDDTRFNEKTKCDLAIVLPTQILLLRINFESDDKDKSTISKLTTKRVPSYPTSFDQGPARLTFDYGTANVFAVNGVRLPNAAFINTIIDSICDATKSSLNRYHFRDNSFAGDFVTPHEALTTPKSNVL